MKNIVLVLFNICFLVIIAASCSKSDIQSTPELSYPAIKAAFGENIDLNNLTNYSGQIIPAYILKDNNLIYLFFKKCTRFKILKTFFI